MDGPVTGPNEDSDQIFLVFHRRSRANQSTGQIRYPYWKTRYIRWNQVYGEQAQREVDNDKYNDCI
jgi:hypothetical protein